MRQPDIRELRDRLPTDRRTDSLTRAVDWSEAEARAVLDFIDELLNDEPWGVPPQEKPE